MKHIYLLRGSFLNPLPSFILLLSLASFSCAQENETESLDMFPLIQVLIHSETLGERINLEQNMDDFEELQEVSIKVFNKWHNPVSIQYKAIWYTESGAEIVEEESIWYRKTILPKSTYEWWVMAPENGHEALVHIQ